MSRFKKLGLLFGVFLVICIATVILTRLEDKKEQIKNSEEIILEIPSADIQTLSWEYEDTKMAFHRDEEGEWLYDEDENFPVDSDIIADLIAIFQAFGVSFVIEDVEDYGQYGLADPVCTIYMEDEHGFYDIQLGEFSTMDSKRYVSIGDGNVYLVNTDPLETFDISLSDVIKHDENLQYDSLLGITFAGKEDYAITYQEDGDDCAAVIAQEEFPVDVALADAYVSLVSEIDMSNYVTYHATEKEIKTYGLEKPELTVTVDYLVMDEEDNSTEASYVLSLGRPDKEENCGYVRVGTSGMIYEITAEDYEALMKAAYNDLRHQELFVGDFDDVTKIDIALDGVNYTFSSTIKGDNRIWKYNKKEIEVDEIQTALCGMTADSFTEKAPSGEEELSMTVYFGDEKDSQRALAFYRYNGTYCLATVDGQPISFIERADLVQLTEAINVIVLDTELSE